MLLLLNFFCIFFSVLSSMDAKAEPLLLCIQGRSFEPGREFLQTRQLQFTIDGPDPGEFRLLLASRGVRDKLWPELQADQIWVMPFDVILCGHEPRAELTLHYTAEDLVAIGLERNRGPSNQPRLSQIADNGQARPAPPKAAPANTPPQARRHEWFKLFYATTRQATGESVTGQAFGAHHGDSVNYGTVEVSIPADHRYARLESPSILRLQWDADPQRHVMLATEYEELSKSDWNTELARRAGAFHKPGVLLFIHGYNNTFEQAAKRSAQFARDLAFPGPTVLFSWPSEGEFLAYMRDEEKALIVWRQMAAVLDDLSRLGPGVPVYVVAHSMGNRVLTQGLSELMRQRPDADQAFKEVVLASPDIGREEFRQRWIHDLATSNAPRYTLYASDQDLPVNVSAWLHGEPRLGSGGPNVTILSGLDTIDASAITREWFGLSHSYFGDSATIMSDLYLLINRGLTPENRPRLRRIGNPNRYYWEFDP